MPCLSSVPLSRRNKLHLPLPPSLFSPPSLAASPPPALATVVAVQLFLTEEYRERRTPFRLHRECCVCDDEVRERTECVRMRQQRRQQYVERRLTRSRGRLLCAVKEGDGTTRLPRDRQTPMRNGGESGPRGWGRMPSKGGDQTRAPARARALQCARPIVPATRSSIRRYTTTTTPRRRSSFFQAAFTSSFRGPPPLRGRTRTYAGLPVPPISEGKFEGRACVAAESESLEHARLSERVELSSCINIG